jgi:hypothetical protein
MTARPTAGAAGVAAAGKMGKTTVMADTTAGVDDVWDDWKDAVNMTASEIEQWLDTDESKEVGQKKDGDDESMRKVVGYVHRHRAQGPSKDVEHSRWRYSLMNWGNDPLKK